MSSRNSIPASAAASPPPSAPLGAFENRIAPRFLRDSRAQLLIHPPGRLSHPIDVTVLDYSSTGIGVVHSEGLLIGQTFIVREPFVTQNSTCIYTVVRSERMADGRYSIGLHVGNTLTDELERYSSPPPPGLSRRAKEWYLVYAVIGTMTIVSLTLLKHTARSLPARPANAAIPHPTSQPTADPVTAMPVAATPLAATTAPASPLD